MSNSSQLNRQSFFCSYCNLDLNSQICYEQHLQGQKHKKKMVQSNVISESKNFTNDEFNIDMNTKGFVIQKEQPHISKEILNNKNNEFKCDSCNKGSMNESSFLLHINGQKHKKKLKELGIDSSLSDMSQSQPNSSINNTLNNLKFKCDLCDLYLPTNDQLNLHMVGKKHLKKLKQTSKTENDSTINEPAVDSNNFRCEICDLTLMSKDQLVIHLAGKKHLKKLASLSVVASNRLPNEQKNDDDSKFSHLNIAWDKYKIDTAMQSATDKKYEFYCALCNKYMQRKLQLVDHLKSKKHHRKIYEKRMKESQGIDVTAKPQNSNDVISRNKNFRFNKNSGSNSSKTKDFTKKINFVPASNSFKSINSNQSSTNNQSNNLNFYSNANQNNQAINQAYSASQYSNSNNNNNTDYTNQQSNQVAYPLMSQYYQQNPQNLQPNNFKRKVDQTQSTPPKANFKYQKTNQSNQYSQEQTQNSNLNYNYYGYGYGYDQNYDQTQTDSFWNNQTNNPSTSNVTASTFQTANSSSSPAFVNPNDSNQYQNFTYNVLSNITSLQYATALAHAQNNHQTK